MTSVGTTPRADDGPLAVYLIHRDQPARCAASIAAFAAQTHPVSVTVVDNGSSPAALAALRAEAGDVEVIETGANLGFGPGANRAFRHWLNRGSGKLNRGTGETAGEWVAVAPHDALPDPDCVARLVAAASARPRAGLACAEFGDAFNLVPVIDKVLGGFYRPAPRGQGWEPVDYPHGTLLLARRALLREVGLFDERYFAYCEEVDLALRARRAGWEIGMVWDAVVRNGHLPSRPIADYLQVRNTLLLVREAYGAYFAAWRCVLAAWDLARKALAEPRRAGDHLRLEGRAVLDFLRGRFGPPPAGVFDIDARLAATAA